MRSKTPLALMEQVVMVLVFALAAALCLRVFVFSNRMSQRNESIDHAVLLAQNTAETVKAHGGVREAQTLWYDDLGAPCGEETAVYEVRVQPLKNGVKGLGEAEICVCSAGPEAPLFTLCVAWQEVNGNG